MRVGQYQSSPHMACARYRDAARHISEPHEFELEILELLALPYSVALEKYELRINWISPHHDSPAYCLNRR